LPQTGYPIDFKVVAGLAAIMTVAGAALVVKNRKENE
jgi:LPXTG-motif cell wall-anchored protein